MKSLILLLCISIAPLCHAGKTTVAVETVELLTKTFLKKSPSIGHSGAQDFAKRTIGLQSKYGDDVIDFAKKQGPSAVKALEKSGDKAPQLLNFWKRTGKSIVYVGENKQALTLFVKFGDDAGKALVKHQDNAVKLISQYGQPAAKTLSSATPQSGKQLAILTKKGGLLSDPSRGKKIMDVCASHGDRAIQYIYKNKGALATAAVLATFLSDPEPYINGVKDLGSELINAPLQTATDNITSSIDWTLITIVVIVALLSVMGVAVYKKNRTA